MFAKTLLFRLALAAVPLGLVSCDEVDELDDLSDPDASADADADSDVDADADGDTDVIVDPDLVIDCPSAGIEDCGPTDGMDLLRAELLPDLGGAVTFVDAAFNPDPESPFDVAVLADVEPGDANPFQVLLLFEMSEAAESMDHPLTIAQLPSGGFDTALGQSLAPGNTAGSSWHFLATICSGEGDLFDEDTCALAGLRKDVEPEVGFEVVYPYVLSSGLHGATVFGGGVWFYGSELTFTDWDWSLWYTLFMADPGRDFRAVWSSGGDSSRVVVVGDKGSFRESDAPLVGPWDFVDAGTEADLLAVDEWSGITAAGGESQTLVVKDGDEIQICPAGEETITAVAWVDWEPPGLARLKVGTDTGTILDVHTSSAQGSTCVQTGFGSAILDLEVATVGEQKYMLVLTEEALVWQMETWSEGD
ncbi:MAG: hypothetical protein M0R80_21325 [Proteobacteria bacterium]|jgi:hypothetical protein|nr:hypothetical protein [Pseudomonadota bacterium]